MAAKRSRTGCQTCRSRKLKCDENRPVCGQCIKSRRPCVPSEGIAFRHEQNASMNAGRPSTTAGLVNFFKYRNQYDASQIQNFVPIPKDLTFIIITDPYSEEQNPSTPPTSPGSYQQVAAHSLEALSTAATDHPTFGHSNPFGDYSTAFTGASNGGRTGYGPVGTNMGPVGLHGSNNQNNNNINFLLNPSSTPSNLIDPSLEASLGSEVHEPVDRDDAKFLKNEAEHDAEKTDTEDQHDAQLAALLRDHQATHEITN